MVSSTYQQQREHIKVIVENLKNHPKCDHGPTLLLSKSFDNNDSTQLFYACSAFRHNNCGTIENKSKSEKNDNCRTAKFNTNLEIIKTSQPSERGYCRDCKTLMIEKDFIHHKKHNLKIDINDYMLQNPTSLLFPLSNDKREAQYFFTDSTLQMIGNILQNSKLNKVICIGAPSLHEYLKSISVKSILLDFDDRFYTFYQSIEFFRYNMFNHYFFDGKNSIEGFNGFLKNNSDDRLCLLTDPPFGCRTEALVYTLKTISQTYQQINSTNNILPIFWIFPYFMEIYIKNEMPEMDMLDYKINYTNHKLYNDSENGRKQGSPIRIFTNIPLKQINLTAAKMGHYNENELYRWCKFCLQWRSKENKHCHKCKTCPSKNGATYIHCNACELCVKPNYEHCINCNRCAQKTNHICEEYQKFINCWICGQTGHIEINCEKWFKFSKLTAGSKKQKLLKCKKLIDRRVCLLCRKIGHNEKNCTKRSTILKEYSFFGVKHNMFSEIAK